jgi:hypothetical protein
VSLVVTGRMHYFASLDGMCEATNIFLNVLMLSKTKGGGIAAWMEDNLPTLLLVNSVGLYLSFLFFRVLLFPYWFYLFLGDVWAFTHADGDAAAAAVPAAWHSTTWFELLFYPAVNLFLWTLSMMWFERIHAGLMKILRAGGDTTVNQDSHRSGKGAPVEDTTKQD